MAHGSEANSSGVTKQLCEWIQNVSMDDVPEDIRTRAKYLILDGLACAIIGSHLPWTQTAALAIFDMESPGNCSVWGYDKKIGPLPAALLNSTAIQGFELDDWHLAAPLHSNSLILPALFAAASNEHAKHSTKSNGKNFLLSVIAGYETGPRVGHALYGKEMLTRGWHSGAVFGPSASAAAVSKLLSLPAASIEDALGIACTQAGGLMAAQFGSDAKRMQHGFAARNGLLGALLARQGYTGIKNVYEEPYGGFLAMFGEGSGKEPRYLTEEVSKDLGQTWQLRMIGVKLHASMAGTHCTIDCVQALQNKYPEQLSNLGEIASIKLDMGEAEWKHGGFDIKRPVSTTGAQMSAMYTTATQLVDGQVLANQFRHDKLDRDIIWELIHKTQCVHDPEVGGKYGQRVTIILKDGTVLTQTLEGPRSVYPGLTNEEILDKWRRLTQGIIEEKRRDKIEKLVLGIEDLEDVSVLDELLAGPIANPIA
ncbi:putative immune-responsive protein [Talaromyces proteolyticus]|uniref:Immune-responsive protein n=1 Tax=Talaromyces proteolyticus TaxID=1131652 RepID=A0AAD4KMJ9_9EURO|nr:putative immune-responsive protein [Talaromyces proteolyticus]KAH8694929.1 putative immune-responsive protein [Talaromyces proteolyticus]